MKFFKLVKCVQKINRIGKARRKRVKNISLSADNELASYNDISLPDTVFAENSATGIFFNEHFPSKPFEITALETVQTKMD